MRGDEGVAAGRVAAERLDGAVARDRVPDAARRVAVGAATLRWVLPIVGILLAPALIPDRVVMLTLLRPNKEILLLGGGLNRVTGDPALVGMLVAYIPLMVFGVWAFFVVGRAYGERLARGDGPRWVRRMIPPRRLVLAQRVLARHGPGIAILGRLAAIPPTLIAVAAGTSSVPPRRFLVADAVGAVANFVAVVAVGLALGRAYERAGPWITGLGAALFVVLVVLVARWLRREAARLDREGTPGDAAEPVG